MFPPRSGDLTPMMAVLGLVVQKPDTAAGIALRLEDLFSSARFSDNAGHNDLPILARQGYIRLVEQGEKQSLDLYEGLPKGETTVQVWVRESDAAPPGWRDALRGKLLFAKRESLPAVLREIQEKEKACAREYAITHRRVSIERERERRAGEPLDVDGELMDILEADEAEFWGERVRRLRRLREEVEGLLQRAAASGAVRDE